MSLLKMETYQQQLNEYMHRICVYIAYIFMFIINKCVDFLALIKQTIVFHFQNASAAFYPMGSVLSNLLDVTSSASQDIHTN